jgi:DNA-binding NarL/FixJ family response regulator
VEVARPHGGWRRNAAVRTLGADRTTTFGGQGVTKLRVLIVDDEDDMRVLLRELIRIANDGLCVAGEATDGDDALRRWREHRPDVVLMDQRMPGLSGLETAERILREHPGQAVVLFTAYLDADVRRTADALGVRACVRKDQARKVIARLRECAAA